MPISSVRFHAEQLVRLRVPKAHSHYEQTDITFLTKLEVCAWDSKYTFPLKTRTLWKLSCKPDEIISLNNPNLNLAKLLNPNHNQPSTSPKGETTRSPASRFGSFSAIARLSGCVHTGRHGEVRHKGEKPVQGHGLSTKKARLVRDTAHGSVFCSWEVSKKKMRGRSSTNGVGKGK